MIKKIYSLGLASILAATVSAVNPKPFTVPEINSWKGRDGNFVLKAGSTAVRYDKKDQQAAIVAAEFAKACEAIGGIKLDADAGKSDSDDITFRLRKSVPGGPEGYRIDISGKGVVVEANDLKGLRYGAFTLLQILEQSDNHNSLPQGSITDAPMYAMRGLVIDAGRKYIPLDYLYTLVDVLSYYKMNTLHVHLNDNGFKYFYDDDWDKTQAAFRMESESFPELTARDGSYSKKEFRDFIKYAESKGVEIIPEIDFPAHSLAFTRYIPEIGSTDDLYGKDHLDLTTPRTYEFLDTLLAEYLSGPDPVFAGPRMHIGTDEYSNRDSTIVELFRGLTDRYIKYVESFGKQAVVWGSLTHAKGATDVKSDDVLMYSWSTGYANPDEMLDAGYKLVSIPDAYVYIVPEAGYYYNYLNNKLIYDEWSPAVLGPKFVKEDGDPRIEGGLFAVWNDHPNNGVTVKDIHHRIFSALPAMSAKTWSGSKVSIPFEEFDSLATSISEAPGVNYLARFNTNGQPILSIPNLKPLSETGVPEIGYDYVIEMDIEGADELPGTKLFESPDAIFWISDPISGQLGFSREGHLATFRQDVRKGDKLHIRIEGNNRNTRLFVNGKLVDDLNVRRVSYNGSNRTMAQSRTLVFPLEKTGNFKSKITNLKVVPVK